MTLVPTIVPDNAAEKKITWTSSNPLVATVDDDGTVTAISAGSVSVLVEATDGSGIFAICVVQVKNNPCPPEATDLGLSVYWATKNLFIDGFERYYERWYTHYFVWGDVSPNTDCQWNYYKWGVWGKSKVTKYCPENMSSYWGATGVPDNKTDLKDDDYADDAARSILGANWRIPTSAEWSELLAQCTWNWTSENEIVGYIVTGPNGNSIFLPANGYQFNYNFGNVGHYGYYWSSSVYLDHPTSAWGFSFYKDEIGLGQATRCEGFSIRPVTD